MRVTILGKRWRLRFVRMRKYWGLADHPTTPGKEIHIDPRHENDKDLLDSVLHESLHCALPEWGEEPVERLATDLTRILWNLGYRRSEPNGNGKGEDDPTK